MKKNIASFTLSAVAAIALSSVSVAALAADDDGAPPDVPSPAPSDKPAPDRPVPRRERTNRPAPPAQTDQKIKEITVTTDRLTDMEERRQSTTTKLIVGREELDRDGDSTLGEILKRLPGVTISGRPGRGGDIRMRGLGSGYTQILLNGDRPPRGFSLDSLSPDQVERIEIIRAPVAEFSTQAIAGTINIVLREDYKQTYSQVRIADGFEQGRNAPSLFVNVPGEIGALSYLLNGSVQQGRQKDHVVTNNLATDPADGDTTLDQTITDDTSRRTTSLHLAPRFSYKFDRNESLVIQPFISTSHSNSTTESELDETVGTSPYASADANGTSNSTVARVMSNYQRRSADGSKLNVKLGFGLGKSDSQSLRTQRDSIGSPLDVLVDTADTRDTSGSFGGKYSTLIGDGHQFAAGWDTEWSRRTQTKVSLDNGVAQFSDSGENLGAETRRLAAFAQDEWEISKQFSVYYGVRWEGVRTATSGSTQAPDVANQSSVTSPLFHSVWRLPGTTKDQIRFSLTHSYRAPRLGDLLAVPTLSRLNSPTSPDRIGNPELKPELASGIDMAFEHYLTRSGIISANIFSRNIRDLMRRQITLQNTATGPRWVSQPFNIGDATTRGLEVEAKFQMQEFFPDGPAVDFRSNWSRFASHVDGIAGPNNRLDQQPKQTANIGFDYHVKPIPLTFGGNLNWTPAYIVQTSDTQLVSAGVKRQVDIYALWKFNPKAQLRLSANNLSAADYLTGSEVDGLGVHQIASVNARTYTTWTLRFELKI